MDTLAFNQYINMADMEYGYTGVNVSLSNKFKQYILTSSAPSNKLYRFTLSMCLSNLTIYQLV